MTARTAPDGADYQRIATTFVVLGAVMAVVAVIETTVAVGGLSGAVAGALMATLLAAVSFGAAGAVSAGYATAALSLVSGVCILLAGVAPMVRAEYLYFTGMLPAIAVGVIAPVATRRQLVALGAVGWLTACAGAFMAAGAHQGSALMYDLPPAAWVIGAGGTLAVTLVLIIRGDDRQRAQLELTRSTLETTQATATALRRSERAARDLADASPVPTWCYDPATLQMVGANDAALQRYGWTRDEFQTLRVDAVLWDRSDAALPPAGTRSPARGRGRHRTRAGDALDVETYAVRRQLSGRVVSAVAAVEIPDDRFVAWQRELLLNLAADLTLIGSADGLRVHVLTRAGEAPLPDEEVLSWRELLRFVHPCDRSAAVAAFRVVRSGQALAPVQIRLQARAGSVRRYRWRAVLDRETRTLYAAAHEVEDPRR